MKATIPENLLVVRNGRHYVPAGEYFVSVSPGGGMRSGFVVLCDMSNERYSVNEYQYRLGIKHGLIKEIGG
jgi:hypothetical protein